MPPRVVRGKARLARLMPTPADPHDADQTEETQPPPTSAARPLETPQNTSSDDEQKENEPTPTPPSVGDLFRGHRFYLARALRSERRHELRILVTQNGGDVVAEMAGGAIEIVERGQLRPNENWVAAEFVEDSIRDGELKNVVEYMAPREDKPKRTPSGRPLKRFFTVNEQAAMLRFLKEQCPKYYNKSSVPERIWKMAADQKLLDRTPSSMHEHYRKQLVKLTKKQRAVVFEKAGLPNLEQDSIEAETEAENETETEKETAPRPRRVAAEAGETQRARLVAAEREEEDEEEQEQEADEEPSMTRKRVRQSDEIETKREHDGNATESEDEIQGRAKKRTKKASTTEQENKEQEPESQNEQTLANQRDEEEEETPRPQTLPPGEPSEQVEDIEPSEQADVAEVPAGNGDEAQNELTQDEPEAPGGEVFQSYWHGIAFDPATRPQLDRFFIPPPPPPNLEPFHNALLNSAAKSAHRTPQRSRRLSSEPPSSASHSTPTPQKRRRGGRTSMDSTGTPGARTPARAAQEDLLSQLEEMVGQRMTPPSRRKSLDRLIPISQASESDADGLLARLQFETAHDLNTICSALYWSSGDSNVARAFLLGHAPAEIWCPKDDQLLVDYMRDDVTEAELANARHRGAFETMSTKRTTRDILRRIQFLF